MLKKIQCHGQKDIIRYNLINDVHMFRQIRSYKNSGTELNSNGHSMRTYVRFYANLRSFFFFHWRYSPSLGLGLPP
jgi:hypothetical protein